MSESSDAAIARSKRSFVIGALGLLAMVFACYSPALQGGFIWDDDDHIPENPAVLAEDGLTRIWLEPGATPQYYPLVFSSFWVEWRIFGESTLGYHIMNTLLHGLSAILLWFIMRRLKVPFPWFIAALFAIHPVQVESVAWISERKNVLSGFFYMLALLSYLKFERFGEGAAFESRQRRMPWYAAALVLFSAALFSKTVTCSLPAVIVLLIWWKRERFRLRDHLYTLPMFLLGVVLALVTIWQERDFIGAQGEPWELSFTERVLIAGRALWFYLNKLILPLNLSFNYPRFDVDPEALWQWAFPAGVAAGVIVLFALRRRIGRGPLIAILIFAGTLFPALGFINVYPMKYSFVADHFQYLACIAIFALLVVLGRTLLEGMSGVSPGRKEAIRDGDKVKHLAAYWAPAAIILFGLGAMTFRQSLMYRDIETLWRTTIERNPDSWLARLNLAGELERQGRVQEAIEEWQKVAGVGPDAYMTHNNLGLHLPRVGRPEEAVEQFRNAIELNPRAYEPYNNLAWLLATHPDASVRNGGVALLRAQRALELSEGRDPAVVATYAAALAENRRYAEAAQVTRSLLAQIEEVDAPEFIAAQRERLALYESGRPFRVDPMDQ